MTPNLSNKANLVVCRTYRLTATPAKDAVFAGWSGVSSNASNGRLVRGDQAMSLGHFQIQKAAWTDVSQWRQRRHLKTHAYEPHVFDPTISRSYAADYLTILHDQLMGEFKHEPSNAEIYAAYNMGLAKFRQFNFDLSRVNSTTASKCRRVAALSERSR